MMYRSSLLASVLVICLLGLGGAQQAPPTRLGSQIDSLIEEGAASKAIWGIYVQDLGSGEVLYRRNADKTLMPASNQKLLTTATALDALGSDYRYQTTLYFQGSADGSTMRGDLIIDGSGDPTFGSRQVGGSDPLRSWAQNLAAMGVTRFEGRLIGDDDAFEETPYGEGWDVGFIGKEYFAPPAGGLVYLDNITEVHMKGSGNGFIVEDRPKGYMHVQNRVTMQGGRRSPQIYRPLGGETIVLGGSAGRSYEGAVTLPISDPTAFTLFNFRRFLEEAGIQVQADLVDIDALEKAPDYERAQPLFIQASPALEDIIAIINKESDNFYAEQVFRTFGYGGSAEGGGNRVLGLLSKLGVATDGISIKDGSGLSRKDMITPEAMGMLLVGMYRHPEHEVYLNSLPQGGESQTTLGYRLSGIPVRAKTGSLEFVRALSGYATAPDGRTLAFSIIANHYSAPSPTITQTIDQIVQVLTSSGQATES